MPLSRKLAIAGIFADRAGLLPICRPLDPQHDPEKWEPVFGARSCSSKELDRDGDSTKRRHDPGTA
ncbi:hypothetical protein LB572_18870 [Mesorhizobium sp. BH1-1-5]|uniref:hypothetical protein n=1 Tax=Mesorhizobium sp. BH1-1-5 TaxID=2876661 RepID=UPI001CCFF1A3|nr:hypothetical protein [Mesorhizobium sp. BH1-1-5]MBZ9989164.1 hypothetical protein [Mesorhizobium sp. BH1-1-5]